MMTAYVIARQNSDFLDSPIFQAGPELEQEAIAVFTEHDFAKNFIDQSEWSDEYGVGELEPVQILRWLESAREDGVNMVVVNPERARQLAEERETVIFLDRPREAFACLLQAGLIEAADRCPTQFTQAQSSQAQSSQAQSSQAQHDGTRKTL